MHDWSHKCTQTKVGRVILFCDDLFIHGGCWKGQCSSGHQAVMLSLHRPLYLAERLVCFQSGSPFPATVMGMGLSLG